MRIIYCTQAIAGFPPRVTGGPDAVAECGPETFSNSARGNIIECRPVGASWRTAFDKGGKKGTMSWKVSRGFSTITKAEEFTIEHPYELPSIGRLSLIADTPGAPGTGKRYDFYASVTATVQPCGCSANITYRACIFGPPKSLPAGWTGDKVPLCEISDDEETRREVLALTNMNPDLLAALFKETNLKPPQETNP